jgi:hypothetical protein
VLRGGENRTRLRIDLRLLEDYDTRLLEHGPARVDKQRTRTHGGVIQLPPGRPCRAYRADMDTGFEYGPFKTIMLAVTIRSPPRADSTSSVPTA